MASRSQLLERAERLYQGHVAEREQLDKVRRYWRGLQARPALIPLGAPEEVKVMARASRVNVLPLVVNSLVQSMYVDGFRTDDDHVNEQVWSRVWQPNGQDAAQTGVHRATFGYGTAYEIVLPGDPTVVITPRSPRRLYCEYGEDPHWPMHALDNLGNGLWRMFDEGEVHFLKLSEGHLDGSVESAKLIETRKHGQDHVPIVRYLDEYDLDDGDEVTDGDGLGADVPMRGQVAPLMSIQDQIDLTTFSLQVAQHYGAFRQRYIIGWIADSEAQRAQIGADRILTIANEVEGNDPDETGESGEGITVGEFGQTDLKGYLESRQESIIHAATLSQTPAHELTGKLINLSAEALAAAEASKDRKVDERQALAGEAHERKLRLASGMLGIDVSEDAEVRWRDTSARAFAATVDALGKLATMLEVPVEELWERIPNTTKKDIDRWKQERAKGSPLRQHTDILDRQAA